MEMTLSFAAKNDMLPCLIHHPPLSNCLHQFFWFTFVFCWYNNQLSVSHHYFASSDLRWWLQLCPVDIQGRSGFEYNDPSRIRRLQNPWQWARDRFDAAVSLF